MSKSQALRAILVGPPGSGKGTISAMIMKNFGLRHVSSGDLLRTTLQEPEHQSLTHDWRVRLEQAMKEGKLVPDDVIERIVLSELKKKDVGENNGWLLDGFPRTVTQAESLLNQVQVDMMLNLDVPDQTIIDRLQGRWVHISSGRIYHTTFNPPKIKGRDDVTGELLIQREDDRPDIVQKRLHLYHQQTKPVINHFNQLGLLKTYSGTESKVLWPLIESDIKTFLKR